MYYDRQGHEIEVYAWAQLYCAEDNRTIESTVLLIDGVEVEVLTKWMGIDPDMNIPPQIFGSIVRVRDLYFGEIPTATQAEAAAAHAQLVSQVQAGTSTLALQVLEAVQRFR